MSKTLTLLLAIGVIIVGGYWMFNRQKSGENQNTDTSVKGEMNNKKMAFSELFKQGGAYKCEVSQYVENVKTKGTTYINNGMLRGEYSTKVEGADIESITIIRDGYTYSWTSALPNTGFKIKNEISESTSDTFGYAEQIVDYNCEAWTVDQSKFTIPANIAFQEITPK